MRLRPLAPVSALILLFLAALALAGCASGDSPRGPGGKAASRQAPPPTLVGQQIFFDGKVTAEAKVGVLTGFDRRGDGKAGEAGKPGGHRGRRHGGGGGFGGGMGGGMEGMGGGGMGGMGGPPAEGQVPRRSGMPGGMPSSPPVMIHLRFTNAGTEKAEVVIADFLSPLGNFVTYPATLTLEPGQSAEVEPMTSRLAGDASGSDITLRLKLGDRQETKTITLKAEAAAPAAGPAAPP